MFKLWGVLNSFGSKNPTPEGPDFYSDRMFFKLRSQEEFWLFHNDIFT